jgi:hypothetical protein
MTVQLRRINFQYYEELAHRVLDDLHGAEDALIQRIADQGKRDALYAGSRADLEKRFRVGDTATLQTPSQGMIENLINPPLLTASSMPGDPADESVIIDESQAVNF